jgi:hypothetical protein
MADGRVLVAGGTRFYPDLEAAAEFYDPATNAFTAGPTMKFPRVDHTATLVGDTVFFVGGLQGDAFNREPISQVESYSAAGGFATAGSLVVNRAGHATVAVGSALLVAGGFGSSTVIGRSAELFQIGSGAINIDPASLPDGQAGVAYAPQSLAANGGTPPFTLSLVSGLPPAGLTLAPQSTPALGQFRFDLAGTPTAPGTYVFNLKASSAGGNVMIESYSIRIDPLNITTSILPVGNAGTAYNQSLAATTLHGPATWTLVAFSGGEASTGNGLPSGLTLNTSGTVTGTPLAPGFSSFTVKARDALGQTATRLVTLQIQ